MGEAEPPTLEPAALEHLARNGYVLVPGVLGRAQVKHLIASLDDLAEQPRRGGMRHVAREVPAVAELVHSPRIRRLVGPNAELARSLLFDKTPSANWNVAWHQDVTIAVRERLDVPGFTAWSVKDGVPHAQPPVEVLARMLVVRIHLDDCGPDNGALRVIPGSHRDGRLPDDTIDAWRSGVPEVTCEAKASDVLLMRPLLLHASSASTSPAHRRVIQLEFGDGPLPGGLAWFSG